MMTHDEWRDRVVSSGIPASRHAIHHRYLGCLRGWSCDDPPRIRVRVLARIQSPACSLWSLITTARSTMSKAREQLVAVRQGV